MENKEEVLNILKKLYADLSKEDLLDFNSGRLLKDVIHYIDCDLVLNNSVMSMFTLGYYNQVIKVVHKEIEINKSDVNKINKYLKNAETIARLTE